MINNMLNELKKLVQESKEGRKNFKSLLGNKKRKSTARQEAIKKMMSDNK